VPITINKAGDLYTASATSTFYSDRDWETTEPMAIDDIVNKLLSIGYHQANIGDTLYNVDPELVGGIDKDFEASKKNGNFQ